MTDPFSIICGVIQVTAGGIAAARQITRIIDGIQDKTSVAEFLDEIHSCNGNLTNIKATFEGAVDEWLSGKPPPGDDKVRVMCSNAQTIQRMMERHHENLQELRRELNRLNESENALIRYIKRERKSDMLQRGRARMTSYTDMLSLSINYINMMIQVHTHSTIQANHQEVMDMLETIRQAQSAEDHDILNEALLQDASDWADDTNTLVDVMIERPPKGKQKVLPNTPSPRSSRRKALASAEDGPLKLSTSAADSPRNLSMSSPRSGGGADSTYSSLNTPTSPPSTIRYNPADWSIEKQWDFLDEALEEAEEAAQTASEKSEFGQYAKACRHQQEAITVAEHILKTHGGRTRDGKSLNVQRLRQDLARYYYLDGEFDKAIVELDSLVAQLPPRHEALEIRWSLYYDISQSYNKKRNFGESAGHAQQAMTIAEREFPPHDERIIATYKLVVEIFRENGDASRAKAFQKRLDRHCSIRTFALAHPELAKTFSNSSVSPIILAAKAGHAETVRKLLEDLPQLSRERDNSGATVLILAAGNKHIDVIRALRRGNGFAFGTEVSTTDKTKETALHRAMRQPPLEAQFSKLYPRLEWTNVARDITEMLLDAHIDVKAQNEDGETCAHVCVQNGNKEILETLLRHDRNLVNITDNEGRSLLHLAIEYKQEDLISVLLARKADIWAKDEQGNTCVDLANQPDLMNIKITNKINSAKKTQRRVSTTVATGQNSMSASHSATRRSLSTDLSHSSTNSSESTGRKITPAARQDSMKTLVSPSVESFDPLPRSKSWKLWQKM